MPGSTLGSSVGPTTTALGPAGGAVVGTTGGFIVEAPGATVAALGAAGAGPGRTPGAAGWGFGAPPTAKGVGNSGWSPGERTNSAFPSYCSTATRDGKIGALG